MDKENEDFTDRLSSLKVEMAGYEKDIANQIQHLYSQNSGGNFKVDLKNDPRNAVKVLHQDVMELLDAAKEKSSYLERYAVDIFLISYH